MPIDQRPIAVFDSGLGGLTVVRELRRHLPHEDIVYFGDTARVPYGTKTAETVLRFARQDCAFLLRLKPKCIVAACNTVSAVCLPALADELNVPLLGVVVDDVGNGGWAALGQLYPGDLIVEVDGRSVKDVDAMKTIMEEVKEARPKSIVMRIERKLHSSFIEIEPNWEEQE